MGLMPSTDCSQIDTYVNAANAAKVSSTPPISTPTNERRFISSRSSIACGVWRSIAMKATSSDRAGCEHGPA